MTRYGQQSKQNTPHSGAPGWGLLTAMAALVVAAHVMVLQASSAYLVFSPGADNAGGKTVTTLTTFTTRNIETAPALAPAVVFTAAPPAMRKAVKTAQNTPKIASNQPPAQQIKGHIAPEIIANAERKPNSLPAAEIPVESSQASTPPQADATLPAGPQSTPVSAVRLPDSVRLQYKVIGLSKNLNYHADAELTWKTDGDSYQAMMKVSAFLVGSRSMSSAGKITASGLAPTRFADKFRTELAAHFEPEKGKISFSANTPDAPWVEGAQDRVSVFLQLGGMLAAKPQDFPLGSNITFLTIGPREADTWTFVIESEENLDLMGAPMAALKLTRKPRKEFDQKVEIWFAPALGYLPVRSRITQQNGDFIDQQLTEIVKSL